MGFVDGRTRQHGFLVPFLLLATIMLVSLILAFVHAYHVTGIEVRESRRTEGVKVEVVFHTGLTRASVVALAKASAARHQACDNANQTQYSSDFSENTARHTPETPSPSRFSLIPASRSSMMNMITSLSQLLDPGIDTMAFRFCQTFAGKIVRRVQYNNSPEYEKTAHHSIGQQENSQIIALYDAFWRSVIVSSDVFG